MSQSIKVCSSKNQEAIIAIEKLFVKNNISFLKQWENPKFKEKMMGDRKEKCVIYVSELQKDEAFSLAEQLEKLDLEIYS